MTRKTINVLQFICPVGFYGAERWILALINNSDSEVVSHDLAVTVEPDEQDLEILNQFPQSQGQSHQVRLNSRFDLSAIKQLVSIIKERQIDIIHTHGYKSDLLGLLAAKKAGIKSVATPHGFGQPSDFKLKLFIRIGVFMLRFFDRVVPLSQQLEDEVRAYSVPARKIINIRNGVDLTEVEQYRQDRLQAPPNKPKLIGFIGQLIPRKNVSDLLEVFDRVQQVIPDLKLQILGDGKSRAGLEKEAGMLQSSGKIEFLGFRHDRMEYLKRFDLFVMTSNDEGIPRCLMEAMGMGVPVAAYDIPGIDQLITHEDTGLLAEFADRDKLTEYWVQLLSDETKASGMAERGRLFVHEKYSGRRMATDYLELYRQLITP